MDIKKFYVAIDEVIDKLSNDDLIALHHAFIEKGCYGSAPLADLLPEDPKLKEAVKFGIQRISIDDLQYVAPTSLLDVVKEYNKQEKNNHIQYPEPPDPETAGGASSTDGRPDRIDTNTGRTEVIGDSNTDTGVGGNSNNGNGTTSGTGTDAETKTIVYHSVNIKPNETLLDNTSRTGLMSVIIREQIYKIPAELRRKEPYAFISIDSNGDPIQLFQENEIEKDEIEKMPISLVDMAVYFLASSYIKWKKSDHKLKLLEAEKRLLLERNVALQQEANELEIEIIKRTINAMED